jgi:hypothetical protein
MTNPSQPLQYPYECRQGANVQGHLDQDSAHIAAVRTIVEVSRTYLERGIPVGPDYCLEFQVDVFGLESPRWGLARYKWDVLRQQVKVESLRAQRRFLRGLVPTSKELPDLIEDVRGTLHGNTFPLADVRDLCRRAGYSVPASRLKAREIVDPLMVHGDIWQIKQDWYTSKAEVLPELHLFVPGRGITGSPDRDILYYRALVNLVRGATQASILGPNAGDMQVWERDPATDVIRRLSPQELKESFASLE